MRYMAMVTWESANDWERLGKRIVAARAARGLSQEDAAKESAVGVTTWRELENGKKTAVRTLTLTALSMYLGWGPDGAFQILMGGEPHPDEIRDNEGLLSEVVIGLDKEISELRDRLSSVERLLVRLVGEEATPTPTPPADSSQHEAVPPHPPAAEAPVVEA